MYIGRTSRHSYQLTNILLHCRFVISCLLCNLKIHLFLFSIASYIQWYNRLERRSDSFVILMEKWPIINMVNVLTKTCLRVSQYQGTGTWYQYHVYTGSVTWYYDICYYIPVILNLGCAFAYYCSDLFRCM